MKWAQMAISVEPEEPETDIQMDIHKISVKSKEEVECHQLLTETDDGGVTAILATAAQEGTNDLSSKDIELLNIIRSNLSNNKMTKTALLDNFR